MNNNKFRLNNNSQYEIKDILMVIVALLFAAGMVWYSIWFFLQPIDYQIEMRCRQGDSVACLSLPGGRQ